MTTTFQSVAVAATANVVVVAIFLKTVPKLKLTLVPPLVCVSVMYEVVQLHCFLELDRFCERGVCAL